MRVYTVYISNKQKYYDWLAWQWHYWRSILSVRYLNVRSKCNSVLLLRLVSFFTERTLHLDNFCVLFFDMWCNDTSLKKSGGSRFKDHLILVRQGTMCWNNCWWCILIAMQLHFHWGSSVSRDTYVFL